MSNHTFWRNTEVIFMKNALKKAISALLVAVMVFGTAPLAGFVGLDLPELNFFSTKANAEETATSGTCGENLTWTFDESTGELVISGEGEMTNWNSYSKVPWYSHRSSIESVSIGNEITNISNYAFYSCNNLTRITVDSTNKAYTNDANGVLFNKDKTELIRYPAGNVATKYVIPDTVTSINDYAFYGCENLARVTISDSVTRIGIYAFGCCELLLDVKIPITLTYIGSNAFSGCSNLKEVNYPGKIEDWQKVYGCSDNDDLEGILVFECNSKRPYYGGVCGENLRWRIHTDGSELTVSGTGEMENYGYTAVFSVTSAPWKLHCSKIQNLIIDDGVTSVGSFAFLNCKNLKKVKFPDGLISINSHAFAGCNVLSDMTLPDSITNIGENAFWACYLITKVTIPNGVTNISKGAFKECSFITKVTIPKSIKVIGTDAFVNCSNIRNVYYGGSKTEWEEVLIYGGNECLTSAWIHYNSTGSVGGSTDDTYNTPDYDSSVVDTHLMPTPTQTTISYGDSIVLHIDPSKIPEGGYAEWYPSNGNFSYSVSADGTTCTTSPNKSGDTTFTAIIYDAEGSIVSADTQVMTSKAGLFDKIIAFFKKLFGLTKTIPEAFNGIY